MQISKCKIFYLFEKVYAMRSLSFYSRRNRSLDQRGQSIIELIIAIAIFALIGAAMVAMLTGSFTAMMQGGEHTQAEALVQEGMEAVRAVRDRDWEGLSCSNCIAEISGGEWILSSGASDTIGQYTRTITLSDVYRDGNSDIVAQGAPGATLDYHSKLAEVEVSWLIRDGVSNSAKRNAYITNWRYLTGAECIAVDVSNTCLANNNHNSLVNATITNNCLYQAIITSTTPTWDNTKKIQTVTIDSVDRWDRNCNWNCSPSGQQVSGNELDFGDNDVILNGSAVVDIDEYEWNGSMSGSEISLSFNLDDGSTEIVDAFSPPDCDGGGGGGDTCSSYCQGISYGGGTCRANTNQCNRNGETYESGGDQYCAGGGGIDTCCCAP